MRSQNYKKYLKGLKDVKNKTDLQKLSLFKEE